MILSDNDDYDISPIIDTDSTSNEVSEDASIGDVVGITAYAEDLDIADSVSYALSNDAGGLFAIDSQSGVVTLAGALDYENETSHTITVLASSTDGSESTLHFNLDVTDANDPASGTVVLDVNYLSLIKQELVYNYKTEQFQINGLQVAGDQATPEIAKFSDGYFVVTWRNDPSDTNPGGLVGGDTRIFAQILDPAGERVGNEFQVNTYEGVQERNAFVETLSEDKFVVIWHSTGRTSEVNEDIRGQILDRQGNKIGDEFTLNSTTVNSQNFPAITKSDEGGFFASWTSMEQDSSGGAVIARKFDSSGNAVTDEVIVNSYTSGNQTNPEIVKLADGNVVLSWMSYGQDGSGYGLYSQILDQSLSKIEGEFLVNSETSGNQAYHSMAPLSNGSFVVVWENSNSSNRSDHTLKGKIFNPDGSKNGFEFKVNTVQNDYGFVGYKLGP